MAQDSNNQTTLTQVELAQYGLTPSKMTQGQTYSLPDGRSFVFTGMDSGGNAIITPSATSATSPNPLNPTTNQLDIARTWAAGSDMRQLDIGGIPFYVQLARDSNGVPIQVTNPDGTKSSEWVDMSGKPISLSSDTSGNDPTLSDYMKQSLQLSLGKTQADIDQIEKSLPSQIQKTQAETGQITAQTGLTNVQTEAAKQQLLGQFNVAASQIASGPGTAASKQEQIDALYNNTINQYNDVVNKAAVLNTYQNTEVSQANARAAAGTNFIGNVVQGLQSQKFGPGLGISSLISGLPDYLKSLGGGPVSLQNPLDLYRQGSSGIDVGSVPTLDKLFPQPPSSGNAASTAVAGGGAPPSPPNQPPQQSPYNPPATAPISSPDNGGFGPNSSGPAGAAGDFQPHNSAPLSSPITGFSGFGPSPVEANMANLNSPSMLSQILASQTEQPSPFYQAIGNAINSPPNAVDNFLNKTLGSIGGVLNNNNSPLPGYAKGGTVPGAPGQPQLAVVHGGEKIIPRRVEPTHPVTSEHMAQIKSQVARGLSPLQAVLNVHANVGGDPAKLLESARKK